MDNNQKELLALEESMNAAKKEVDGWQSWKKEVMGVTYPTSQKIKNSDAKNAFQLRQA